MCGGSDGGREHAEKQLELRALGGGNIVQWKLPGIFEGDLSEDS